ncbi:hypothetical protein PPOLYM_00461 [Paenibacillus polymyxa]|uniref:DUF3024 domain-containing protein n=1 Tax=Paenibacillus polymyxa TaxID=1406 RepID=UPI000B169724|nr:DUF3024 domain-containing protein [Paenibacillus polymyxa]VUG04088.1 hypothetical protein PPOLYM_00461 [Paenibacillus polymyxa]
MNERIDPFTVKKVEYLLNGYIALKVPGYVRSDVRLIYQIEDNCLILTEERPSNETESWDRTDIVQFRWEENHWHVYARQEAESWQRVKEIAPNPCFEEQLEQIEIDPAGIFWTG